MHKSVKFLVKLLIFIMICSNIGFIPVSAYQIPGIPPDEFPTVIQNGGFEDVSLMHIAFNSATPAEGLSFQVNQNTVPGWSTTATDDIIEIWQKGFRPPSNPGSLTFWSHNTNNTLKPYDPSLNTSNYFAEINGTMTAALYQDLSTDIDTLYQWHLWHRGRTSPTVADKASLTLGAPYGTGSSASVLSSSNPQEFFADNTQWIHHSGFYLADSAVTRFYLQAVSTANNDNRMGNLVDDITWAKAAALKNKTVEIDLGDSLPDASDMVYIFDDPNQAFTPFDVEYDGNSLAGLDEPGDHYVDINVTDQAGQTGKLTLTVTVKPKINVLYTLSGNVNGLPDNSGQTVTYATDGGTPQTVTTDSDGNYIIPNVPKGADVIITPPDVSGYASSPDSYMLDNITADIDDNNFLYIPIQTFPTTSASLTEPTEPTSPEITTALSTTSATESHGQIPGILWHQNPAPETVSETETSETWWGSIMPTTEPVTISTEIIIREKIPAERTPDSTDLSAAETTGNIQPTGASGQIQNNGDMIIPSNDIQYNIVHPASAPPSETDTDNGEYIGGFGEPLANVKIKDINISVTDETAKINPKTADNIFSVRNLAILAILLPAITFTIKHRKLLKRQFSPKNNFIK